MTVPWLILLAFAQESSRKPWIWVEPAPPTWERTPFATTAGFGSRIATLDDVDCDGVPDLAISASLDQSMGTQSGSVFVVSGADGHLLHRTCGEEPEDRFGETLSTCPDIDGDGAMDVIVQSRGRFARLISGKTGVVLRILDQCDSVLVADLDLDGISDFVSGSMMNCKTGIHDHRGLVTAFSGRDHRELFSIHGESAVQTGGTSFQIDGFGGSLACCGDLDGDGVPDLAAGRSGAIQFLSGRTGAILRATLNPSICRVVACGGDVDGDGFGDAFTASNQDGPVLVCSGRTGEILRTLVHDRGGGYLEGFGDSISITGDLDRDGTPDVAVGCSEFLVDDGDGYGVEVYSGRDARLIATYGREASHAVVGRGSDFNGDGIPDLPVGFPALDEVVILSGRDFPKLADLTSDSPRDWPRVLTLSRAQYPP